MEEIDSGSTDQHSPRVRNAIAATMADLEVTGVTAQVDRAVAFAVVLAHRLGVSPIGATRTALESTPNGNGSAPPPPPTSASGDALDRIAATMKLPRDVVELVYDARDDELTVIVAPRMLAGDKANATRQLAQIVAGGRQAAGMEEWTSMSDVRPVVTDYGKYDAGNFAAYIAKLDNVFRFSGKGTNRAMKVTRPGMESVAEVVRSVSGAGS
jgi:hypothetical protein